MYIIIRGKRVKRDQGLGQSFEEFLKFLRMFRGGDVGRSGQKGRRNLGIGNVMEVRKVFLRRKKWVIVLFVIEGLCQVKIDVFIGFGDKKVIVDCGR